MNNILNFTVYTGAVDSVIYATTRNLIKPISFPTRFSTFGDNSKNSISSGTTVLGQTSTFRKSTYGESATYASKSPGSSCDDLQDYPDTPRKSEQDPDPARGVQVTLERIEEVI
jgi:hypothetical protein